MALTDEERNGTGGFNLSLDEQGQENGAPKRVSVKINEVTVEESTSNVPMLLNGFDSSNKKTVSGRSASLQSHHQFSRVSSGAETSDSDQDLVKSVTGLKQDLILAGTHDWNRSASSRSRNKQRPGAGGISTNSASLNVSQDSQRPLSVSTESTNNRGEFTITMNGLPVEANAGHPSITRARSLAEPPYKTSLSVSGVTGGDTNKIEQLTSRALSIEHRQANMSQMSISSQLSKNSSVRNQQQTPAQSHHPHQQAAMLVQQMMLANSATVPTPRESLVFFRGDEKPIAKLLLHQTSNRSGSVSHTSSADKADHQSTESGQVDDNQSLSRRPEPEPDPTESHDLNPHRLTSPSSG